jgi:hypothetical protein
VIDRLLAIVLSSANPSLKGILSGSLTNLHRALEEFVALFDFARENPKEVAAVARLNELGALINSLQDGINRGLAFDPLNATPAQISGILSTLGSLQTDADRLALLPDLAFALGAFANNTLSGPAKTLVASAISDGNDLLLLSPPAAFAEVEALGRSLTLDPRDFTLATIDHLQPDLRKLTGAQLTA